MFILKNHRYLLDEDLDSFMWDDEYTAFIKFYSFEGKDKWIVYTSDGTKIAEVDSREQAFIVARQNDFQPCSAH